MRQNNIGYETEWENIRLVEELCNIYAALTSAPLEGIMGLITYVKDRPGHDRRMQLIGANYSMNWAGRK